MRRNLIVLQYPFRQKNTNVSLSYDHNGRILRDNRKARKTIEKIYQPYIKYMCK